MHGARARARASSAPSSSARSRRRHWPSRRPCCGRRDRRRGRRSKARRRGSRDGCRSGPAGAAPASSAPPPRSLPPAAPDPLQGDAKKDATTPASCSSATATSPGARLKFKAAYDATKDHRPLWNWAACEKNLRHYSKAQNLIADYLKDASISADERSDAERLRDTLAQFTAPVTFTVTEAGADIAVDGESIGQSPLAGPVTLDMGARKVDVTKAGFKPFSSSVNVGAGSNGAVSVKLDPDVHQGHLVIKATAGAAINIDGAPMGVGSWQGTLATGGHELRVTAPGMRSFHDEVTLLDDQTRTLDITLEPESSSGMPKWVWIPIGPSSPQPASGWAGTSPSRSPAYDDAPAGQRHAPACSSSDASNNGSIQVLLYARAGTRRAGDSVGLCGSRLLRRSSDACYAVPATSLSPSSARRRGERRRDPSRAATRRAPAGRAADPVAAPAPSRKERCGLA